MVGGRAMIYKWKDEFCVIHRKTDVLHPPMITFHDVLLKVISYYYLW